MSKIGPGRNCPQLPVNITSVRDAARLAPYFEPIYVPIAEAREWFGISRDTLYRQRKLGNIPIYKAGGRSVVKVSEVRNWIENHKAPRQ